MNWPLNWVVFIPISGSLLNVMSWKNPDQFFWLNHGSLVTWKPLEIRGKRITRGSIWLNENSFSFTSNLFHELNSKAYEQFVCHTNDRLKLKLFWNCVNKNRKVDGVPSQVKTHYFLFWSTSMWSFRRFFWICLLPIFFLWWEWSFA